MGGCFPGEPTNGQGAKLPFSYPLNNYTDINRGRMKMSTIKFLSKLAIIAPFQASKAQHHT